MTRALLFFSFFVFSISAVAVQLSGNWERSKVECASGDQPQSNWQSWRVILKFESSNSYTLINQREEFISFETGEYFIGDINQICFTGRSDLPSSCYDLFLQEGDLRLGEFMKTPRECGQDDYVIRYFKPQQGL